MPDYINRAIKDLTNLAKVLDEAEKERVHDIIRMLRSCFEQGDPLAPPQDESHNES